VTMAINGHETDKMHNHYSTVNEVEIRTALSRATELAGLRKVVEIGGKTGVPVAPSASKNPRQRRSRPTQASLGKDSGRFSSSHGVGSIARRLAGRGGAGAGGGLSARAGRSDARQEAGIVAAGRAHGLLSGAALLAEPAAADRRVSAGVRRPRKSSVRWRGGLSWSWPSGTNQLGFAACRPTGGGHWEQ